MKIGDVVICVQNFCYEEKLTIGKEYQIIFKQPGIFETDTYITVIGDHGLETTGHDYRFELKEKNNA